jgi:hypothetical protein
MPKANGEHGMCMVEFLLANAKEAIHDGNKIYYNDWRF